MKRVGDVLSGIFDEGLMSKARGFSQLFSCWKDLTLKNNIADAADHSWIESMEKGLVWIEVDHPGWKQILQTKEDKLLSDFQRRFPEMDICGISIMLCKPGARPAHLSGASAAAPPPAEKETPPETPSAVPPAAAELSGYDAIKDEALKEVLMRLEHNILDREKTYPQSDSG